ncbi:MAG TPA: carboxypeptidase regulatory-like domain-containing protein, partial [Nitriliruptorales bacterium]|nr:carboxypeptidase regulatory-like domain-containing protein [Nitriliruptorales bacterium]
MRAHHRLPTLVVLLAVVFGLAAPSALANPTGRGGDPLANRAARDGHVRVIVRLAVDWSPEGGRPADQAQAQRQRIRNSQARVRSELQGTDHRIPREFEFVPYTVVVASPAALERLQRSRNVADVIEDQLAQPDLADSVPLVGADQTALAGQGGAGKVVAVIDTGVDTDHGFLAGSVVEEACYASGEDFSNDPVGDCPNGQTTQTGTGSGVPCTFGSACFHGTHVAGIAAGSNTSFQGVAPEAGIMAIQAASHFTSPTNCGTGVTSCVRFWNSDVAAAMERVYALRTTHDFAAVNLSLGGGRYTSEADCDAANGLYKTAADNLRSVGIATAASSGNSGYKDGIGAPACVSSIISVGNTTKLDVVNTSSNSASYLDLLAPGTDILSAYYSSNTSYAYATGTSMSAPHVAGAWAVLHHTASDPATSVTTVLDGLTATGVPITDSNGVTTPRIDVLDALNHLSPSTAPADDDFPGQAFASVPAATSVATTGATLQTGEPQPCGSIGATVWYSYTPSTTTPLIADTAGSDYDTVLAVHTGTSLSDLTNVACNDDAGGTQSQVEWTPTAGTTYYLQAGGSSDATGNLTLNITEDAVGSISGTVVSAADGTTALASICVQATGDLGGVGSTTTAADGTYTLSGLAADTYRVEFTDCNATGFAGEWFDDKPSYATANPVTVTVGANTTVDEDLAVLTVRGSVLASDGTTPVADALVEVTQDDGMGGWSTVAYTSTASDGTYGFALADGTYRLQASPPTGSTDFPSELLSVTVTTGTPNPANPNDLVLRASNVEGTVRDPAGAVAGGGYVEVSVDDGMGGWSIIDSFLTGTDGVFRFRLDDGSYQLVAFAQEGSIDQPSTALAVSISAGVATPGKPHDLDLRTPNVSGTVFAPDGTTAVADAPVVVSVDDGSGSFDERTQVTSISDGRYGLLLEDGSYRLVAQAPGGSSDGPSAPLDVTVSGGTASPTNPNDLTLRAPNLAGTVLEPDGVTPAAAATVDVQREYAPGEYDTFTMLTSDSGGAYGTWLEDGNYRLIASPPTGSAHDPSDPRDVAITGGVASPANPNDLLLNQRICPELAPAIDLGGIVTGESWLECSYGQANAATALTPTGMATSDSNRALLTSGAAALAEPPNDSGGTGRDNGTSARGAFDVSIKQLHVTVPTGANCLSFQLVFGSDEYPEYVGSAFNDAFLAELDTSDWSVDGSTITAPSNFAVDPGGNLISINSVFFAEVVTETGTEYDGATPLLIVRTPVTAGAHTLYLSIFDAGDGVLDSGAFVDNLQATTEAEGDCVAGAGIVPERELKADFNGDGFADQAIGVPLEDSGPTTDMGRLTVVYGSATGLDPATSQVIRQSDVGEWNET